MKCCLGDVPFVDDFIVLGTLFDAVKLPRWNESPQDCNLKICGELVLSNANLLKQRREQKQIVATAA